MQIVVGVDGWRGGWVAVALQGEQFAGALTVSHFTQVLDAWPSAAAIGVDIPIGLLDTGLRQTDAVARKFLERRGSSIFNTPTRPAVDAETYDEANAAQREAADQGLSRQSWALVPKIREIDALRDDPRLAEVHPEVSFRVLSGSPLAFSKKTWGGHVERRNLLTSAGIHLPDDLVSANPVPPDDVLDAAVAAWSARRIALGQARSFPDSPTQRDGHRLLAIRA